MRERLNQSAIVKWLEKWSPILFGPMIIGVLVAVALSTAALVRSNHEAEERSKQTEQQVIHQRNTFCGFAGAVANLSQGRSTILPQTENGRRILEQQEQIFFQAEVMRKGLGCDKPQP